MGLFAASALAAARASLPAPVVLPEPYSCLALTREDRWLGAGLLALWLWHRFVCKAFDLDTPRITMSFES